MNWRGRLLLDVPHTPKAGDRSIRLREDLRLEIDGRDVQLVPADQTIDLPHFEASLMIRNGLAEPVEEAFLPHVFAKKSTT